MGNSTGAVLIMSRALVLALLLCSLAGGASAARLSMNGPSDIEMNGASGQALRDGGP